MSRLVTGIKIINLVTCLVFITCCSLNLSVSSETPEHHQTALSVVDTEDSEDVEVTIDESDGEIQFDKTKVFKPTRQWQTVEEDQAVPGGLHIRMNLETGIKEAKLMEGDTEAKYWKLGDKQGMVNSDKKIFSREELKRALKDFKSEVVVDPSPKNIKKFKSYKELKKELDDMNVGIKTDMEIITDLLRQLRQHDTSDHNKKFILTDLEYYLHQIDNSVYFCDVKGLETLLKCLNDSSEEIRSETALVLGSALQSNPKAQVSALDTGLMQVLLRLISLEKSVPIRKRYLYAISSFIRHFPFAQLKFLQQGGLSVFSKLFDESGTEILRVKAVTLLHDLVVEKTMTENDPQNSEKLEQYKKLNLKEAMVEGGWCELIPTLLGLPEHDSREKIINAMTTFLLSCSDTFSAHHSTIFDLRQEYLRLSSEEKEDDYFVNLYTSLKHLAQSLHINDEL